MKIYLASSWNNTARFQLALAALKSGHEVFDFTAGDEGDRSRGFHWSDIDPDYKDWDASRYLAGLADRRAKDGFLRDFEAMQWADVCVLALPCGRSAHLELGWFVGQGKPTAVWLEDQPQAELMYGMVDYLSGSIYDIVQWLDSPLPTTKIAAVEWLDGPLTTTKIAAHRLRRIASLADGG